MLVPIRATMAFTSDLPVEIFEQILSVLDQEPPSSRHLLDEPSAAIYSSDHKPLKSLSETCHALRDLTARTLFTHVKVDIHDSMSSLSAVLMRYNLQDRPVRSVFLCNKKSLATGEFCNFDLVLDIMYRINPFTLIIALPPATLGDLASIDIDKSCAWAFRISFQVLRLSSTHERHHNGICHQNHDYDRAKSCNKNLFQIRPWTQMFFNEGSSIPVYSLYEYYEYSIPSFIHPNNIHGLKTLTSHLQHLTTFEYVAVFPFGHTDDICRLLHHLRNLRILRTQLAPKGRDLGLDTAGGAPNVVDIVEHAGHGEPKDLWMEFENSYRIFHHWIILAENRLQHLQRFEILDYANEGLRETLNTLFPVNLMPGWANQGGGIWVKQVID